MLLYSPLEQFQILPYLTVHFFFIDLSIYNSAFIALLGIFIFLFFYDISLNYLTNELSAVFEILYETISEMIFNTLGEKGQIYFPLVITIFSFILIVNIIGLIPYSFTMTSHLCVTLALAVALFIGINIIGVQTHGSHLITLFLPGGTSLGLSVLLVPIELISYLIRPVSLSVRLFANMTAGHTLLKVIIGFAWSMFSLGGVMFIAHFIPIIILIIIMGLEFGVALIQAYVFTILTCIYLNDAINLH